MTIAHCARRHNDKVDTGCKVVKRTGEVIKYPITQVPKNFQARNLQSGRENGFCHSLGF